ncbi:MAG: winged helix-turn-helix transcriptional regulator [Candidatus Omnitrophica bacterium]|nr:winged helix-turn-helix transcriptional regulator [Candidatus Omnitrophota bacterium]
MLNKHGQGEGFENKADGRETREKTREKILRLIRENPMITTSELAKEIEVTPKGVEWNLKKLKNEGHIKRVGSDKGGHWETVME